MSLLFDNEEFIANKIRAVAKKMLTEPLIMDIDFMTKNRKDPYGDHSILIETYDLTVDFIKELEKEFQTRINMIFGTNKFTTQIFINRSPILRLLD